GCVIGVDHSIAEVTDQKIAGEGPEARRRDREAPWRVQGSSGDQALLQRAIEIEYIDKSVSSPGFVVVFGGVLLRVSHVELAVDDLVIERGVPLRQVRVCKVPG